MPADGFRIDGNTQARDTPRCAMKFLSSMRSIVSTPPFLSAILSAWAGLFLVVPVQASAPHGNDGSVILRMCKGADKVKSLSMMCHGYLNGYLDAAHHYGKGKTAFCLEASDKLKAPAVLVAWIDAHPDALTQPAGAVLHKALTEQFPCTRTP